MVDAPKMAASTEPDFLEKTVRVAEADVSEGSFPVKKQVQYVQLVRI